MRKVEVTIEIDVKPDKIIQAFVDPEMLESWWGVEQSLIEKRAGGLYTLAWMISDNGFGYVTTGSIKNYEPARLLEVENLVYLNPEKPLLGPMKLTVKATKKDDKTLVYICQDGYKHGTEWDWYYNAVNDAWPLVAVKLKDFLEKTVKEAV